MRARPREVNIFNMSLLDILCGALGAFCFMMLVALPYYIVGTPDRARSQQRTEELLKDLDKLRERMSDPAQAEELRRLIEEMTAQIKQITEPDRGFCVWVSSQTIAGSNYRVFVKEANEPASRRTTGFSIFVFGDFPQARLALGAVIVLGPQRPWDFVGTISVDDKWKISFKEATQAERDAEWRKRNLTPPPVPTEPPVKPTPAARPTATPIDHAANEAERQRGLDLRKKREEEQRRREQQQSRPSAGPSAAPTATP